MRASVAEFPVGIPSIDRDEAENYRKSHQDDQRRVQPYPERSIVEHQSDEWYQRHAEAHGERDPLNPINVIYLGVQSLNQRVARQVE